MSKVLRSEVAKAASAIAFQSISRTFSRMVINKMTTELKKLAVLENRIQIHKS